MNYKCRLKEFELLCKEGKTIDEISKLMNVTKRTIFNYEKKTSLKCTRIVREPNLNKHFFKEINSEAKAYILGFIYADGYIESNERTLTLNINKKDKDILLKIKNEIGCTNEIRKSSTNNCIRLYLSSVDLVGDLKKIGISRSKTHTIKFPEIDEDLMRHFIRGYFDGDGHIGKRQCALVIGSEYMYNDFIKFIEYKFNKRLYSQNIGNYYRIQFNRCDYDIINWIYSNSNIYIDRKYKSFCDNWKNYKPKG